MKYPNKIKQNNNIFVCAPSRALTRRRKNKIKRACRFFKRHKLNCTLSPNIAQTVKYESAPPLVRAKEVENAFRCTNAHAVLAARGGELMVEILPLLNFDTLAQNPKWYLGYSDNTALTFTLPTLCDIATIYGYNFQDFGKRANASHYHCLNALTSKQNVYFSYAQKLNKKNYNWEVKNSAHQNLTLSGRLLGGCLDILVVLCGTKFDNVKGFQKKYPEGNLWFFETYDINTAEITRALWQLKNSGWFEGAKGFLFGRPYNKKSYLNLTFENAVSRVLEDLGLPIIFNCEFGHVPPALPLFVGANATINVSNNRAKITYEFN